MVSGPGWAGLAETVCCEKGSEYCGHDCCRYRCFCYAMGSMAWALEKQEYEIRETCLWWRWRRRWSNAMGTIIMIAQRTPRPRRVPAASPFHPPPSEESPLNRQRPLTLRPKAQSRHFSPQDISSGKKRKGCEKPQTAYQGDFFRKISKSYLRMYYRP